MLKALIIGHLGKDAVINTTQNGTAVINFSVAHSESFKDKDGNKQTKTVWCDCSWWTDKHAIVPYLKKGTQVYIEGNPEVKTFSKQDGSTGASLSIRVLSCQLLGGNSNSNEQSNSKKEDFKQQAPGPVQTYQGGEPVDDLPF
jgi:single-strand DNA-binding protein